MRTPRRFWKVAPIGSIVLLVLGASFVPNAVAATKTPIDARIIDTHRIVGGPLILPNSPIPGALASRGAGGISVVGHRSGAHLNRPVIRTQPSSVTLKAGSKGAFVAVASGVPAPRIQWKESSGKKWNAIAGATSSTYRFVASSKRNGFRFEATFANSAGSATSRAVTLKVQSAPVVTTQPVAAVVVAGSTARFSAAASGVPTPGIRWQRSSNGITWTQISGAISRVYSFTATSGQSSYRYKAVFTNSLGKAISHVTTLTVTPAPSSPDIPAPSSPVVAAPVITTQPGPETVTAGQMASFSATASGSPTPAVQWEESIDGATWAPISGATSTVYAFAAPVGDDGFRFAAVFSNSGGSVTSSPATLTVTPVTAAPAVVMNPTSTTVTAGETASFSASASGSPTPSVQWEESSDGATWTPISGATAAAYSIVTAYPENGYRFEAVFTNATGTATTSAATLTVTPGAPSMTTEPSADTATAGQVASFSAAASGSPTPTVQWEESTNGATWAPISGATSATYSLVATSSENGYTFEAVFTNAGGSATSSAAVLTVEVMPDAAAENWSGYADTGATFTSVGSTWTVPTVTCSGMTDYSAAEWIGIDGYSGSDATVEQDGTSSDCVSGTPNYDAWFEMYGDSKEAGGDEEELNPVLYPVSPGDVITASVSVSDDNWTLALEDSSGWSFSTVVNFAAAQSSAEWIVERPETCIGSDCTLTSLAEFSPVTFTNSEASTTSGSAPISSYPFWDIEMVNTADTEVLALPSGLNNAGTSFSDTWGGSS